MPTGRERTLRRVALIMLIAALEVLVGLVAVVGFLQAAALAARGYKARQRELMWKRLGKGRDGDRPTAQLPIQAGVQHEEADNTQDHEQYPSKPANK
jgi:hypothetical protein